MKSRKYLNWVKSLDCCRCGAPADDPHHLIGIGNLGGMGMKAPDETAIPLCRRCHGVMHVSPELWPDQWEEIVRTIVKAFKDGIIKVA